MRRTVKILAVLSIVVAFASAGAWAQSSSPNMPNVRPGDTYLRSDIWKNVSGTVTPLPEAQDSGPQAATRPAADNVKGSTETFGGGSAIPTSAFGAAFLTPSERTGSEIRKVIKRLG